MSNSTTPIHPRNQNTSLRKGHVKLFHRKSRTGCQRCRARRVKCNEAKPTCHGCERLRLACVYDTEGLEPRADGGANTVNSTNLNTASEFNTLAVPPSEIPSHDECVILDDSVEPEESKARRMLEVELMYFYITTTGPSISFDKNTSYDLFVKAVPSMALKSDALLYTVYAFASLHRTKTTGGDDPAIPSPTTVSLARKHYQQYVQLAFQHHRQELSQLSRGNVDILLVTANLMRLIAFFMLSDRVLEPYVPALDWLRITNSHARVFREAWDLIGEDSSTQTAKLIRATPVVWDYDERQGAANRKSLQHILLFRTTGDDDDDPDSWDADVRRAYESTLSYIGGILQCVQNNDPLGPIGRRLVLFPILIDKRFIELVGEARPRALVVMAHYFALVTVLRSFWFIGNTGFREVKAITLFLPVPWQSLLKWPLHAVEKGLPYSPRPGSSPDG